MPPTTPLSPVEALYLKADVPTLQPAIHTDRARIYHTDCLHLLRSLPDASVDSIVTDPPYGLEFMGKEWDAPWKTTGEVVTVTDKTTNGIYADKGFTHGVRYSRGTRELQAFQTWVEAWAVEALRVLKPGGHLLAFGGTRTWHRLACAIEDAGFEIRDSIAWLYGSGFPKSLDVSKAIDKAAGAEREIFGHRVGASNGSVVGLGVVTMTSVVPVTAPATPEAATWQGWGTALKPAHEPIVVARKPLTGTVAANVLQHGTGALNIDACRIGTERTVTTVKDLSQAHGNKFGVGGIEYPKIGDKLNPPGRWPANVITDETTAALIDEQSGTTSSRAGGISSRATEGTWTAESPTGMNRPGRAVPRTGHDDSGGASRFFYCAKAPTSERPRVDGTAHPTVKPLTLMRWLCRLVTPPGGHILEPFAGSGTTIEAALLEGFTITASEMTADYLPLIQARLDRIAQGTTPTPEPEPEPGADTDQPALFE